MAGLRQLLAASASSRVSVSSLFPAAAAPVVFRAPSRRLTCSSSTLDADYGADQIQVLEGLEPVRKRPGMYIGSTGQRGLHHLVYEIVDNAIDEVQAAHATEVRVEVDAVSGWVRVSDNGRGIPTDIHPVTGKSSIETVLTVLHAGGKFGGGGYTVSGGLHGVGLSVVNALSEELRVTVRREGLIHTQAFSRGVPLGDLETAAPEDGSEVGSGTEISFLYDRELFSEAAEFDTATLGNRLRELSFLNSAATIRYRALTPAAPDGVLDTFQHEGGLREYVAYMSREKTPMHTPIHFMRSLDGVEVEVALQWCSDSYSDSLMSFANSIRTVDGGTHLDGLTRCITRVFNALARHRGKLKEGEPNLSGEQVREGLRAVLSVKVGEPEFEGQTKTRLGNPEVRGIVERVVADDLTDVMERDASTFNAIVSKAVAAQRAAEAAKKARELVRRKSVLTKTTLPGKLADCSSKDLDRSEIFIVEGDSAGGSAKQARDRMFQAILPLRGKILNVERKDDAALYKNQELSNLIVALGLGVRGELTNLRYGKIVLLTDADVDGAHIRTLLLTFLFRYSRSIFEEGNIYVAMPPLYKLESAKELHWCYDDADLRRAKEAVGDAKYTVQRFKGLGEMMPQQLWDTTLNPETRVLKRLTVRDMAGADDMFDKLMGDKVAPRRRLIEEYASSMKLEQLDI